MITHGIDDYSHDPDSQPHSTPAIRIHNDTPHP